MRVPLKQMIDLGRYIGRKKRTGEKYFPLVLMLEPLHACNLACVGCGRIVEYQDTIRDMMSLEEALQSANECGAPIVSICGGEPLMYKHIAPLTTGLIETAGNAGNNLLREFVLKGLTKNAGGQP